MNERVLENWLDSANERAFQQPFCHSLAAEGYQVIHMSRHCAMEMGKDILAIDPKGTPCAFQLKNISGKQMKLSEWRNDLEKQIYPLVHGRIVHPSIQEDKPHRSFIVLNGEISEEVARAIDDFNRGFRGRPKLVTVVRGEILTKFKNLRANFWPSEISVEFKLFLELYLTDGKGSFSKPKFAQLLESVLKLEEAKQTQSQEGYRRIIAAITILCSYALAPYQKQNNHYAEFEAWTMLFAYILAFAEKNRVPMKCWKPSATIVSWSIYNALGRLADDAATREDIYQGDILTDSAVHDFRLTTLSGAFALYALWRRRLGLGAEPIDTFLENFNLEHMSKMFLWGESASPLFCAAYLYRNTIDPSMETEGTLIGVIRAISILNAPDSTRPIPNPYYSADQVMPHIWGDKEQRLKDPFAGNSYCLEAFWHLLVRRNLKQLTKNLWPQVSFIHYSSFEPQSPWNFFQWNSKRGVTKIREQAPRKEWSDLRKEADDSSGNGLPSVLRNFPLECLAFSIVYPHRFNSSMARWLDQEFSRG